MTAEIIDGKAFAVTVRAQVAEHVTRLKADHGITPGLAVVLVGEDPASEVYVRNKGKQTIECGMNSFEHKFDAETSEALHSLPRSATNPSDISIAADANLPIMLANSQCGWGIR